MVADALIQRTISALIQDICLRMTVMTPVRETIKEAQSEAIKEENRKSERVVGQILSFHIDHRGLLICKSLNL